MLDKAYRRPREIDPRDIVFDPRPKTAMQAAEELIRDIKEVPEAIVEMPYDYEPPLGGKMIHHSPLDRIAEIILGLTYGEMIDLVTEIWDCRGDGIEGQEREPLWFRLRLPAILLRWAKTHE